MGIPKKGADGKEIPTYTYGAMSNPDVLTDYYTRRHTSQYRSHFFMLAQDFIMKSQMEPANAKLYKEKARKLLLRSLEVMPAELVIDYGEPQDGQEEYLYGDKKVRAFSDGLLDNYVRALYMAGDKAAAEKLGETLANQLESIMNYHANTDIRIAAKRDNMQDFYAAMDAYYKMNEIALDANFGQPKGALATRTYKFISVMLQQTIPKMIGDLNEQSKFDNDKKSKGSIGIYESLMLEMQVYTDAMAIHYDYKEDKQPAQKPTTPMSLPLGAGIGQ
jgi:hypothetical protein